MNADVKGALNQINTSWKAFVHNGQPMTKRGVKSVLEYAVKCGYEHTGQISEAEIDSVLTPGTTKEQWERYYVERLAHERHCNLVKPQSPGIGASPEQEQDYRHRLNDWERMRSMDAPNKPGYYRANND